MKTIKGKVIVLNTTGNEHNSLEFDNNKLSIEDKQYIRKNPKHLYVTSDEEIKKGDWVMNSKGFIEIHHVLLMDSHKIIATTDKSLNLPSIPQSFINTYIEEYNKGNVIEDVEIYNDFSGIEEIKSFNNEPLISIKPIKDSWTREEVVALLQLALATGSAHGDKMNQTNANSWIKNNI